jgi:broad specificity phosphatase PhoE
MRIYLVRHGQSQWQVQRSEDLDTSLTAIGHEQSKRLGQWLGDHPALDRTAGIEIAALCTSPFKRAQETIACTAETLRLPLFIHRELGEADFHVADHLPQRDTPLAAYPPYRASAAYAAFKSQARVALQTLLEQAEASDGPVLAVAHGGLLKTLLRLVVDSDNVCFRLYNTGLNLIEWSRGRWHLVYLNLGDHLPPELRTW